MPPNIIYILADDMGYGDVSCLNPDSAIRTTHIDRLAAEGMRFTDAHASSAVCTPSRYSILTGRYCWRSRLKKGVVFGYGEPVIEDGRATVASMLRDRGYTTGCIGKWHLGWDWAPGEGDRSEGKENTNVDFTKPIANGPTTRGFDYFYGISGSLDMAPYVYVENDRVTAQPDRVVEDWEGKLLRRAGPTGADFDHEDVLPNFTRRALDFVDRHGRGDRPYFLYLPLAAPHTPILPVGEFKGKSGVNEYADFCLMVDDVVGQLMAKVDELGQAEETIVIFTTDNGASPNADFEELGRFGHRPSYHFRGHKFDIYEGGHRIPFVMRWPGTTPAGSICDETVCLGDLFATCAEITGHELRDNEGEDSVSNLALWRGETPDAPLREATVHHSSDGSFSIRKGRWKLELCPGSGGRSYPAPGSECEGLPPIQLYDLEADVSERENLQDRHPEVVEELKALLTKYVCTGRSTPGEPQANFGGVDWPELHWMLDRAGRKRSG